MTTETAVDIEQLLLTVVRLRAEKSRVKKELAAKELLLLDEMERLGLQNFASSKGPSVYMSSRIDFRLNDENRPAVMAWLREHGRGGLVKEDVNRATLGAEVRKMMEEGIEMPEFLHQGSVAKIGVKANGYDGSA